MSILTTTLGSGRHERNGTLTRLLSFLACLVFACCFGAEKANSWDGIEDYQRLGYVVVTPAGPLDGGDFGPQTPGTKTAGIQEAIDYALASLPQKNVWIAGKQDMQTRAGCYEVTETIHVPPSQGFTIDGGLYLLGCSANQGPAIWIDSAMNCKYHFGLVGSPSKTAPAVLIKPLNMLPIDTWASPVTTVLDFRIEAALGGSAALAIDATAATIGGNTFFANEIASSGTGLLMVARAPRVLANNEIRVTRNHGSKVQVQIGDEQTPPESIAANQIAVQMDADDISGPTGLDLVSGENNRITIYSCNGMAPNRGLIFGPNARQNVVAAMSLASGMTNLARIPNNRLIPNWPVGYDIETPAVDPSDHYTTNRYPYSVEVHIRSAGHVSEWSLMDANGIARPINGGLTTGQSFTLAPGDALMFKYSLAPAWLWRAIP